MLHPDSKILWEDFSENYGENSHSYNDGPSPDDDEDDDDDFNDNDGMDHPSGITAVFSNMPGFMGGQKHVVSTPWGQFLGEDKFSPTEFYSLKVIHFYKFSVYTIPDLPSIMDSIDGVAIWKCQDPYCIILGKGKAYEWDEVAGNVEMAILGRKQGKNKVEVNPNLYLAEEVVKVKKEDGIVNYITAIFPNGKVVDRNFSSETKDEYNLVCKEVLDLIDKLPGIVVIQDGEILCK